MLVRSVVSAVLLLGSLPSFAAGLREPFEWALALSPELIALSGRRVEIEARRRGADALLPGPASVSAGYVTDELTEKEGYADLEVELGVPVWLPGQARAQRGLANAELTRLDTEIALARLAVAAEVRDTYWAWGLANASLVAARSAAESAASLARDSARQLRAGQIAPVEELLARADASEAENLRREAEAAVREARTAFVTLTGREPPRDAEEGLQPPVAGVVHPRLQAARSANDVGRASLRLAQADNRDSPELALVAQRERDASSRSFGDRIGVRIRIPFPYRSRNAERRAAAVGEIGTAVGELAAAERALGSERERAGAALEEARAAKGLLELRFAALAEAVGLADQALAGGQTNLVETLRVRTSVAAADADRRRAAVALRQAISRMNQAEGYEP